MALDFNSLLYSNEAESDEVVIPADQEDRSDLTNAKNLLLFDEWSQATPEERKANGLVDVVFNAHLKALKENKDKTVKMISDQDGTEKEYRLFTPDGNFSPKGQEYLQRVKALYDHAAEQQDGGVFFDAYDNSVHVADWTDQAIKGTGEKQKDLFPDFDEIKKLHEETAFADDDTWSYEKYAKLKNKEDGIKDNDPAALDPYNEDLKKQFEDKNALASLKPEDFKGKALMEVAGRKLINPEKVGDIPSVEESINDLDGSEADKELLRMQYRSQFNEGFTKFINEAAAAESMDAGFGGIFSPILTATGGAMKEMVGMDRQDLTSKYERFVAENKGDAYEFAKQNAEVFNKDNYGFMDKLTNSFWTASRATGSGFMQLGAHISGNESWKQSAAEYAGDSQYFNDLAQAGQMDEAKVLWGLTTNKELYDLGGQVASMMATFGTGSIVKGAITAGGRMAALQTLTKVAATSAGAVAGGYGGAYVGGEIGEMVGGEEGGEIGSTIGAIAGSLAGGGAGFKGGNALTKSKPFTGAGSKLMTAEDFVTKASKSIKDTKYLKTVYAAVKDPSAYIGGLQASGMSFGDTYNRSLESGMSKADAYKQAHIEGRANGLGAWIATAVFNRVAPGAERFMSGGDGSLGKSLIANISSRIASREGKEATKKTLETLVKDKTTRDALFKGIKASMDDSARKAGLRGYGPIADVAAESVEEFTDSVLSDVFSAYLDDEKNWQDEVWAKRNDKILEYFKAGVMGAIGGGMGASVHTTVGGAKTVFSAEERANQKKIIIDNVKARWDMMDSILAKPFEDNVKEAIGTSQAGQEALGVAEYIASFDGKITPKEIAKKGKVLADAAQRYGNLKGFSDAYSKVEPEPEAAKETKTPVDTSQFERTKAVAAKRLAQLEEKIGPRIQIDLEGNQVERALTDEEIELEKQIAVAEASINQAKSGKAIATKEPSKESGSESAILAQDIKRSDEDQSPLSKDNIGSSRRALKQAYGEKDFNPQLEMKVAKSGVNLANDKGTLRPVQIGNQLGALAMVSSPDGETKYVSPEEALKLLDSKARNYGDFKAIFEKAAKKNNERNLDEWTNKQSTGSNADSQQKSVGKQGANEATGKTKGSVDSGTTNDGNANETPSAEAVSPVKGVVKGAEKISSMTTREHVNKASKVANDAGIDVVVVSNKAEAEDEFEEEFDNITDDNFSGFASIDLLGRKVIVIHSKNLPENEKDIKKLIKHEMLHIAEEEFRNTEQGLKLWNQAVKLVDKQSPEFNKELQSFMEKEYPGYSSLSNTRLKFSEVVRAFLEGKMDQETSGIEAFKKYVTAFVKHVKGLYSKNPEMSEYIQGVEAQYASWFTDGASDSQSKPEPSKDLKEQKQEVLDQVNDDAGLERIDALNVLAKSKGELSDAARAVMVEEAENADERQTPEEVVYLKELLGKMDEEEAPANEEETSDEFSQPKEEIGSKPLSPRTLNAATTTQSKKTSSFDAISSDGNPVYVVSENRINNPEAVDRLGGRWVKSEDKGIELFTYIPAEGTISNMDIGAVVSLGTEEGVSDSRVLVLTAFVNNEPVFRLMNLNDAVKTALSDQAVGNLSLLSDKWNANRLGRISDLIRPKLNQLLDTELISDEDFQSIMDAAFSVIAPDYDSSAVVYKELEGSDYFSTIQSSTKNDDGTETQTITIVADKAKMVKELKRIFTGYDAEGSYAYKALIGADVARMFTSWVSEESIHRVVLEEFNKEGDDQKLIKAADEIRALQGDNLKGLKSIFDQTVKERFDKEDTAELTEDEKIVAMHETMRKVSQLSKSGITTEWQIRDIGNLVATLNMDERAIKANSKTSMVKTVVELFRRYAAKLRRVLYTRMLLKKLTPELKEVFSRLERATQKGNLQQDVDLIDLKGSDIDTFEYEGYKKSAKEKISKAVFNEQNQKAITELKQLIEGKEARIFNVSIDDVVEVDPIAGLLKLSDWARNYIKDVRPDVNIEAIDKALADLNALGMSPLAPNSKQRGQSSVRIAQAQLSLAYSRKERLLNMIPDVLDMFDIDERVNAMVQDNGFVNLEERGKLFAENLQRIKNFLKDKNYSSSDYGYLIKRLKNSVKRIRANRDLQLDNLDQTIIAETARLDVNNGKDLVKLQNIAQRMEYVSAPEPSPNATDEQLEVWMEQMQNWHEGLVTLLSKHALVARDSNIPNNEIVTGELIGTKVENPFARLSSLTRDSRYDSIVADSLKAIEISRDQQREFEALQKLAKEPETDKLNDDISNLQKYDEALKEYNDVVKNFTRIALGDFGFSYEGRGQGFVDLSIDRTKTASNLLFDWESQGRPEAGLNPAENEFEKLPAFAKGLNVFGHQFYTVSDSRAIQSVKTFDPDTGKQIVKNKVATDWRIQGNVNGAPNPYRNIVDSNAAFIAQRFLDELLNSRFNRREGYTTKDKYLTNGYNSPATIALFRKTGGFNISLPDGKSIRGIEAFPKFDEFIKTEVEQRRVSGDVTGGLISPAARAAFIGKSVYSMENGELYYDTDDTDGALEREIEAVNETSPKTVLGMVDRMTLWVRTLKNTVEGAETTLPGGQPTLAGHLQEHLMARLLEAERHLSAYRVEVANILAKDPDSNINAKGFKESLLTIDKQSGESAIDEHAYDNLNRAYELLTESVDLTRKTFDAYVSKGWNASTENELTKISRDRGYDTYKGKEVRDYSGDLVVDKMMDFYLEHFAGRSRKFRISPTFALDLLKGREKFMYSNDGLEKVSKLAFKNYEVPVFERDDKGEVIMEDVLDEKGNPVYEQFTQYHDKSGKILSEPVQAIRYKTVYNEETGLEERVPVPVQRGKQMVDENGPVTKLISLPGDWNHSDLETFSVNDRDADGRPTVQFSMGEQSTSRSDQPMEWLKKRMDDPYRAERKWFSSSAMIIGMNIEEHARNKEGARDAVAVANDFKYKLDSIRTDQDFYFDEDTKQFVRTEASGENGFYREVVQMGIQGLFGATNFSQTKMDSLVEEFLKGRARTRDPMTLLTDLIEFKAEKEKDAINKERVSKGETVIDMLTFLVKEASAFQDEKGKHVNLMDSIPELKGIQVSIFNKYGNTRPALLPERTEDAPSVSKPNDFTSVSEIEAITLALIKDKDRVSASIDKNGEFGGAGLPIWRTSDLRESETPFVSDNLMVSLFLQNNPHDAIIYAPAKPVYDMDGVEIGMRFIPSRVPGQPHFIYAPQGSRTSRDDARKVIVQSLLEHAKIEDNKLSMREMAADIRKTLSTHIRAKDEAAVFNSNAKLLRFAKREVKELYGSTDKALIQMFAEHMRNMQKNSGEADLAFVRKDLDYKGEGVTYVDKPELVYVDKGYSYIDDAYLIAELFTNSKLKTLYDYSKADPIEESTTDLSPNLVAAIYNATRDIRAITAEDQDSLFNDKSYQAAESENDESNDEFQESDEGEFEGGEEGQAEKREEDEDGDLKSFSQLNSSDFKQGDPTEVDADADPDTIEISDQVVPNTPEVDQFGTAEDKTLARSFNRLTNKLLQLKFKGQGLGDPTKPFLDMLAERKDDWAPISLTSADAQIIKFSNDVISRTKEVQRPMGELVSSSSNRSMQITATRAQVQDAYPVLIGVNEKGAYLGAWNNLHESVNGRNQVRPTIGFAANRRARYIGEILSTIKVVNDTFNEIADSEYDAAVERNNATKEISPDRDFGLFFTKRSGFIELNNKFLNQLNRQLPPNLLQRNITQNRENILGRLNPITGKLENGLVQRKQEAVAELERMNEVLKRFQENISNADLNKVFTYIDEGYQMEAVTDVLIDKILSDEPLKIKNSELKKFVELVRSMNEDNPSSAEITVKIFVQKAFDNDGNQHYVDMVKELLPTRTDRLELISKIGFLGNVNIEQTIGAAKDKIRALKDEVSEVDKELNKVFNISNQIMKIATIYIHPPKSKDSDDAVPLDFAFAHPSLVGLQGKALEEATARLKQDMRDAPTEEAYDFYIKAIGVLDALNEYADNFADDAYKLHNKNYSYDSSYKKNEAMRKAMELVKTETQLVKERFNYMQKYGSMADFSLSDISPELFAAIADPKQFGTIISVSGLANKEATIKMLKNPKNSAKRAELFGRMVQIEGSWVMLAPTTFKADIQKRFGGESAKPSVVKKEIRNLVLNAIPSGKANAVPTSAFEFSEGYLNEAYGYDFWIKVPDENGVLVEKNVKEMGPNGTPLSRKEVADKVVEAFSRMAVVAFNNKAEAKYSKDQMVTAENPHVKATLDRYGEFIRRAIYANGHPDLKQSYQKVDDMGVPIKVQETADFVAELLAKLNGRDENNKNKNGGYALTLDQILGLNLERVSHKILADIQGKIILNRLTSGLVTSPSGPMLMMNKYAFHQDARIRSKFAYDAAALDEAVRLQTYLDKGFDGRSGREGYEVQRREIEKELAESRKKLQKNAVVGASSLDQAKARTWAWLEGMKYARNGSLHMRFRDEIGGFLDGIDDLHRYKDLQKAEKKNAVSRFISDEHVDLMRDIPATDEIARLLKGLFKEHQNTIPPLLNTEESRKEREEHSLKFIALAQKALLGDNDMSPKIEEHGKKLIEIFKGIADSMELSRILSYSPDSGKTAPAGSSMNSIVPMLYTYANTPGSERIYLENKFKDDPKDIVDINEASIFGKAGRYDRDKKTKTVIRPININGITGIDSLIDDSLYRMNVTPNYNVLRKAFGRRIVDPKNGMDVIDDSSIHNNLKSSSYDNYEGFSDQFRAQSVALAAIASEFESEIENDSRRGVSNTALSEASQWLTTQFIGSALISFQQLFVQTVPAAIFTPIKKLAIGDTYAALTFLKVLGAYGGAMAMRRLKGGKKEGSKDLASRMETAVAKLSPWNIIRSGDGIEQSIIVSRKTNRYGYGAPKVVAGRIFKEIQTLQERGLDLTIASGERIISRALYITEVLAELNRRAKTDKSIKSYATVEEFLSNERNYESIPPLIANTARMKVNDMFGQADQSKKGWLFQTRTSHAGWNQVLRSATRFSNHTATTSANMTAFWPSLGLQLPRYDKSKKRNGLSIFQDFSGPNDLGKQRIREEAIENFIGTLGQNILFQFIKPRVLIPMVATMVYGFGDDDDDEATIKGAQFANELMGSDEDAGFVESNIKALIFGSGSHALKDWRDPESARKSVYADLLSKTLMETAQALPVVGAAFGYMPVNNLAKESVVNDLASQIMALGDEMEVAKTNNEKKGIRIYERDANFLETASQITAPTAQLYRYGNDMNSILQSIGIEELGYMDYIKALASQIISTREYRSAAMSKIEKANQLKEMQEKSPRRKRKVY